MDFVSSNFAFLDQGSEDLFQIFGQPNRSAQLELEDDQLLGNMWTVVEDAGTSPDLTKKRSVEGEASPAGDGTPSNKDDSKKRKIIHRDVERQRRQEMGVLYASLRTMLPLRYLKGKRSISDHMHEAVNYIKHLQSRIEKLNNKRQELHKLGEHNLDKSSSKPSCSSKEYYAEVEEVIVRPCLLGVELVISTGLKQAVPLSTLLQVVAGEGLSVVSCISAKVNETFVHTILSEVSCWRSIDLLELQQKLKKFRVPISVI